MDKNRVEGDFTLMESEFVNFISTLITCHIVESVEKYDMVKEMTCQEMIKDLTDAWQLTDAPDEAHSVDGNWVHVIEGIFVELEAIGLSIPDFNAQKKKLGRPPKKKVES